MINQQSQIHKFLEEVNHIGNNNKSNMSVEVQLDRLTNEKFLNPYDVLMLTAEAPDEEIRKQYRLISLIIHPDKCQDGRAYEAFHVVEQAYKTLQDNEKRKIYQRIMREAREKTEFERTKENKRRTKEGLPQLPKETFMTDYQKNCKYLFEQIEERKNHFLKMEESQRIKRKQDLLDRKLKKTVKEMSEEEWEQSRDQRVQNWRNFNQKQGLIGTKKSNNMIRKLNVKQEERPSFLIGKTQEEIQTQMNIQQKY